MCIRGITFGEGSDHRFEGERRTTGSWQRTLVNWRRTTGSWRRTRRTDDFGAKPGDAGVGRTGGPSSTTNQAATVRPTPAQWRLGFSRENGKSYAVNREGTGLVSPSPVVAAELELNPGCCLMYWSPEDLDCRPRKVLEMKRSFPWDEPDQNPDSSSNDIPLPIPSIDLTSQDILIRRAEMYQEYMKQIPIPSQRGSVIPFNSWMGLGKSMKQLYGQPLHYLTNVILKQWDQLRLNSKDEYKPLDNLIHPTKAEATIWLMEEVHRQTSSHFQIAELWKLDPMYNGSVDAIFPTLENAM
ncbi:hypothetical protein DS421_14g470810 [Arachis hypogaea]|nr:hypothetical protein DS421_14g470810 [Arachis hypogaea]